MGAKNDFSADEDRVLVELRLLDHPWEHIARKLQRHRATVAGRCAQLRPDLLISKRARDAAMMLKKPVKTSKQTTTFVWPAGRSFDIMPAGHDVSWGAIWLPVQIPADR